MVRCSSRYSYGPVPSRRLGASLGINNIPAKVCSYSCVYCQAGRTTRARHVRQAFYEPEDILDDVRTRVQQAREGGEVIDFITFVPDGEPTLDVNLGREIELLKDLGLPVGAITNSSLLWRDDVRAELSTADWVSVKVDSVDEKHWREVNRPHSALRLEEILDGMVAFSEGFDGELASETMLVAGLNDSEDAVREVSDFVRRLGPHHAYLSIPTRPPLESWVRAPSEETLNSAYQLFTERVPSVEYLIGYEGNAFSSTGVLSEDLLNITAVHPMREDAVGALLERVGASWEIVDRLVSRGELVRVSFAGRTFYVRQHARDTV